MRVTTRSPLMFTLLGLVALIAAFSSSPVFGGGNGNGIGPPDGNDTVKAEPIRGKPVKIDGKDMKLWVFVHPERGGKGKKPPKDDPGDEGPSAYCDDGAQDTPVPAFAAANPNGLTFNIKDDNIPLNEPKAITAIEDAFSAWDSVDPAEPYFKVNGAGGAARPVADGNNTVGWVKIVPRNVLAAAWVWTDTQGNIEQADVFFNAFHKWGVFTTCDDQSKFEVGNIGTHEFGHVVGLDHLSDGEALATMFPTASKGEVRKRTLTQGDADGYENAGGY